MANAYIISEYNRQGQKQLLLERLQGNGGEFRVITVKHYKSLDTAKQKFLEEIPAGRKDYFAKVIEDHAQHEKARGKAGHTSDSAGKKRNKG